ncbi:MAG TPA: peptidylprolyl isomerase, partial [Gemmatimonadaceae bacterium]|nr:peptidylprolyl isomerase [Gemmatimonadaceae bacterium]
MLKKILIPALLVTAVPVAAQEASLDRLSVDRVVAVVGSQPILWSEVLQSITQEQARGIQIPRDSAGQMAFARQILETMIDEELVVQKAREMSLEPPDADLRQQVDQQIAGIRTNFPTETELREALIGAGFSSIEDYRRTMMELARRNALQRMLVQQLRQERKLPAVTVTEQEINETFEQFRGQFEQRPATVTFRQIVVPPQPGDEAKATAKAMADSILAELRRGGDFESIARRESMDPGSRDLGGDLGWARRGTMVPAFEYWLFTLPPGQTSPVFETVYGYHILRVDRVQPAERKSRHVLIRPELDSAAIARTRAIA